MTGNRRRNVAVLIESSRAYGRGLIEGVGRFCREKGDWSIYYEPRGMETPPLWLRRWKGDGILTRFTDPRISRIVAAWGVPVVDLYATATNPQQPMVAGDNDKIGALALDHLWGVGLRNFGCCGVSARENLYLADRGEAFRRRAEAVGCPCSVFSVRTSGLRVSDWKREQDRMIAWLKGLRKPVGILACIDELGFQLLSACAHIGLRVPEEVAVVGVGNDALLCDLGTPSLTSIDQDAPRMGYVAAALLDCLMRGGSAPRQPIRVEPKGLVTRQSTDILAIPDRDVATALRLIRERACDGIRVEDIVRRIAVSCCVLERKFRQYLGRTPKAELLRVQMVRARELLAESDLSLKEVARRCGFSSEKYFGDAFCREVGIRPGRYRKQRSRSLGTESPEVRWT